MRVCECISYLSSRVRRAEIQRRETGESLCLPIEDNFNAGIFLSWSTPVARLRRAEPPNPYDLRTTFTHSSMLQRAYHRLKSVNWRCEIVDTTVLHVKQLSRFVKSAALWNVEPELRG